MPLDQFPIPGVIRDGGPGNLVQIGTPLVGAPLIFQQGVTGYGAAIISTEGTKPTYSAASIGLVPAASATDVFTLVGSAAKTIRLLHVWISGIAGTAINVPIVLFRRTALDTGGTAATSLALPVAAAHDPNSPAASATLNAYTANPTINNTGAILRAQQLLLPTSGAAAAGGNMCVEWDFTVRNDQAPVLRGAAQCLALNLNGASVTSGSLNIEVSWTEE